MKNVARNVRVVLYKPILNRRYFITGFHGIGLVGHISVRYLISALNCERVGYIEMSEEPAYCGYVLNQDNITTPGELYHSEKCGVTIFMANCGFFEKLMYPLTRILVGWVIENGYEMSILFGGLDSETRGNDPSPLRVVTTTKFKQLNISKCDAKEMDLFFNVVGPLALMLSEFERNSFPAIAILPYAYKWRADPSAAAVGIEYFSKCFNVPVDIQKLRELATKYEEELLQIKKAIEEEQKRREGTPYYI